MPSAIPTTSCFGHDQEGIWVLEVRAYPLSYDRRGFASLQPRGVGRANDPEHRLEIFGPAFA
jgi:hypothetical protein